MLLAVLRRKVGKKSGIFLCLESRNVIVYFFVFDVYRWRGTSDATVEEETVCFGETAVKTQTRRPCLLLQADWRNLHRLWVSPFIIIVIIIIIQNLYNAIMPLGGYNASTALPVAYPVGEGLGGSSDQSPSPSHWICGLFLNVYLQKILSMLGAYIH